MKRALNHMTVPHLGYRALLDLASSLDCVGVELRNDLAQPLFDGLDAAEAGAMARDAGLRIVGLSQVYPFNVWSAETETAVRSLTALAAASGAETISLIPRNDGQGVGNGERHANLRIALKEIRPIVQDAGLTALIEPLGFARASLRDKRELVDTIAALDASDTFRLVHDTFHHALAGAGPLFPTETGIVHISGVTDAALPLERLEDEHRVLIDDRDRLGNIAQLRALFAAGYDGPVSFECFSPQVHDLRDPRAALLASFDFISSQLAAEAA